MTELKPCPFCGSVAFVTCDDDDTNGVVSCNNVYCDIDMWGRTKEEAIERWNRRAT